MSTQKVVNVYKIQHSEGYEWLAPVDRNDYDRLIFDGKPSPDISHNHSPIERFRLPGGRVFLGVQSRGAERRGEPMGRFSGLLGSSEDLISVGLRMMPRL